MVSASITTEHHNTTTTMISNTLRRAFTTTTSSAKVGFIGLGNMGGHMANNLLAAGKEVVLYDIFADPVDRLVSAHPNAASAAATPKELASSCDTIITMLPSNPHVKSTYMDGETGLLAGVNAGTLFIDSSTIDPAVSREVAAACEAVSTSFVDAPVSGGVGGAEAGTLTFMVGGADADFAKADDVLSIMGGNIVHCGGVGTGEVAKLCNNLVLGISMAGVCEAMKLGENLGIDTKVLAGIMNTSTARCWSSDTYNPCPGVMDGVPSSNGYQGGFGSALMQKDLGLALDASRANGVPAPMGATAFQLYSMMMAHGAGGKDFSALFEFLEGTHTKNL
jgi:3-hydroxyisobutyrate dehydrogenase